VIHWIGMGAVVAGIVMIWIGDAEWGGVFFVGGLLIETIGYLLWSKGAKSSSETSAARKSGSEIKQR
jgi:hypothetical protein